MKENTMNKRRLMHDTQPLATQSLPPEPSSAPSSHPAGPVKFVALYGLPTDVAAFERHYAETHVPLAHQLPGIQRVETALILSPSPGEVATYYRIAELWFADIGQLQTAAASAEGQALEADVANFATGGVTLLVARAEEPGAVTLAGTPMI
jgi:uncharacterized protein (TIGR02118 family)